MMPSVESQLPMMRRIARRYARMTGWTLGEDDLLQDAVLDVVAHLDRFDPERGSFSAFCRVWALRGVRCAIQQHRSTVRAPRGARALCVSMTDADEMTSPQRVDDDDSIHLSRAFERLPAREQRVAAMRLLAEMEQSEVAEHMQLSRQTVGRIERDAVHRLRLSLLG